MQETKLVFIGIFIGMALTSLFSILSNSIDKDDTDSANSRSGMILYVDDKTNCQYLAPLLGGLVPRMDKNGKQICEKTNEQF